MMKTRLQRWLASLGVLGLFGVALLVPGTALAATHSTSDTTALPAICTAANNDCFWADQEADGAAGGFRAASVEFKLPPMYDNGGAVIFGAGLGGLVQVAGASNFEGVMAGISYETNAIGGQPFIDAVYQIWGVNGGPNGYSGLVKIHFNNNISIGDTISVTVHSHYHDVGYDLFIVTDKTTGETEQAQVDGFQSDGYTGECFGSRIGNLGSQVPLAQWTGGEELDNCSISGNNNTHNVGNWGNYSGSTSTWRHLVNTSGTILERVSNFISGSNNADFDLTFVQAQ